MKFTINRTAFLNELAVVSRAISGKTTMPILTGVKIQLTEKGLHLTGSNGEISIESFLSVANETAELVIQQPGEIVLQARFLNELVKKLPNSTVYFELLPGYQMAIQSGKAEFLVNGIDAGNYPHLPAINSQLHFNLPVLVLKNIINETVFSVSTSESRPILTGIHLQMQNHQLLAVATDSRRLSQRRLVIEDSQEDFDIVVPGKSLVELSRSGLEDTEDIQIFIMENQVVFKTATMNFYSRLLEGNYPDTSRLIPTSFETEIQLKVPEFLSAIDRASLFSHESRNNIVRLEITHEQVTLQSNSPEVGKVSEEVSYLQVKGEPQRISFNPDFMKNALQAFGNIEIVLKFISPIRPFTLEPVDQSVDFIQLITPVRTND